MALGLLLRCNVCGFRPIAFEAKALTDAESKYHIGEQELWAVVHALELWTCYLQGPEFTVATDHSPKELNEAFRSAEDIGYQMVCAANKEQTTVNI